MKTRQRNQAKENRAEHDSATVEPGWMAIEPVA
jgi:hypothetical protein